MHTHPAAHGPLTLFAPIGRVLLAWLFVPAGLAKLMAAGATAGYMATAGLPAWPLLAAAVGLLEVVAGLALALGYQVRWAAWALALFTLAASLLFHNHWAVPAEQQFVQQLLFNKNLAVVGACLFLTVLGAGPWSLDNVRARDSA